MTLPNITIDGVPYREYAARWGHTRSQSGAELYNWSSEHHEPDYEELCKGIIESALIAAAQGDAADVVALRVLLTLAEAEHEIGEGGEA